MIAVPQEGNFGLDDHRRPRPRHSPERPVGHGNSPPRLRAGAGRRWRAPISPLARSGQPGASCCRHLRPRVTPDRHGAATGRSTDHHRASAQLPLSRTSGGGAGLRPDPKRRPATAQRDRARSVPRLRCLALAGYRRHLRRDSSSGYVPASAGCADRHQHRLRRSGWSRPSARMGGARVGGSAGVAPPRSALHRRSRPAQRLSTSRTSSGCPWNRPSPPPVSSLVAWWCGIRRSGSDSSTAAGSRRIKSGVGTMAGRSATSRSS